MEIPKGNFFEVTINSNKLINFIQSFTFQINNVEKKILSIQKSFEDLSNSISSQMKKNDQARAVEFQKLKRIQFQQINYNKLFLKDMDKRVSQNFQTNQQVFTLFDNRINFIKTNIEHDMVIKDTFFSDKLAKESHKIIELVEAKIKLTNQNTKARFDEIQDNVQEFDKKYCELMDKENDAELKDLGSSRISIKSQNRQKDRSRCISGRRLGTFISGPNTFNKLHQKLSQFEDKISLKSSRKNIQKSKKSNSQHKTVRINESHNTYISKNQEKYDSKSRKEEVDQQMQEIDYNAENEAKRIQFQSCIQSKLNLIQKFIFTKTQEIQKGIMKINNRNDIFKEQISIVLRRVQKNKDFGIQLKESLKHRQSQEQHTDYKLLDKMKNGLAKLSKQLEEISQTKLSFQYFQKQKVKIYEKIASLKQLLGQKAQKYDVKKGFNFLQEKIKEIIVVIMQQKNQNRDSATKKIPFKCLSCDKSLDFVTNEPPGSRIERHTTNPMTCLRSTTNLIRKRKRAAHNSIVNDQY